MATIEQLAEGIRRADKTGDTKSVQILGAEYKRMISQQQPKQQSSEFDLAPIYTSTKPQEPSFLEKAGAEIKGAGEAGLGIATGMTTGLIGGALGTIGGIIQAVKEGKIGTEEGSRLVEHLQRSGMEAGTYMPSTPEGQRDLSAISEPLSAIAMANPAMTEFGQLGQLAKATKPIVAAKGAEVGNVVAPMISKAKPTPKAPKQPKITQEAIQSAEEAKKLGIDVMTSDISKPQTFIGKSAQMTAERIPIVGTGAKRETQQAQRLNAVKAVAEEYKADSPIHGLEESVIKDLAKTRSEEVIKYAGIKNEIFDKLKGTEVSTPKANEAIDAQISRLQSMNNKEVQPIIDSLNEFKRTLNSGLDIVNIEANRKLLGEKFKAPDLVSIKSEGEKSVSPIYNALREDMGNFIKQNGEARDFTKWQVANKRLSESMAELEKSSLKSVLKQGKNTPESISRLLYSNKPSDNMALYSNLSNEGKANARSAILGKIYQDSIDSEGQLSTARFLTGLNKMDTSISTFFKGQDKAKLEGLKKALALTKRAEEAKVLTNTGQQLSVPVIAGAAGAVGGWGGLFGLGTLGAIARAYESPMVRDALIKMSKTKNIDDALTKASTPSEKQLIIKQYVNSPSFKMLQEEMKKHAKTAINPSVVSAVGLSANQNQNKGL